MDQGPDLVCEATQRVHSELQSRIALLKVPFLDPLVKS